ncbi:MULTISPECIES: TadE/TadG family type IV pilus assembly protein [unclassified Bradyrhizobium]|uniref:TadE/TadG family type IV pilus assembly protein n=1 Tax=Bradyrhizobium sp. USDA 4541 TaxID=2817704 RepID=UPI0020A34494|nr:TadE/TadG family type IV pilus assembly protein [Bradyrhizobium sp. USDA 4541]MCP1853294.1 Flp pilus assembly protein TadG [Bradyrhizobium sp. USDA 4541]
MTGVSCPKVGQSMVQNISRLMRDRRGVSALMFVASSVGFMSMAGFGMEVSTWYLERRHGQNTADAAAIAGVLAIIQTTGTQSSGTYTSAQTAGSSVATDNGYTSGLKDTTVTIQPGSYSGGTFSADSGSCSSSSCNAVKATIVRGIKRSFTALVMGKGSTNVTEVAIAARSNTGDACSLALAGGLGFSGSAAVTATNCSLASNATGPQSITFNGAGSNKTQANAVLVGAGGCTQNGSGSPCTQPGNLMYQPSSLDPYAALLTDTSAIPSTVNAANCPNSATAASPHVISTKVFCVGADLTINNASSSLTLTSGGTYFFYNSSIRVSGGSLICNGCTIIFTGSSASQLGSLSITGGTVTMSATKTPAYADANYAGILFYMDYRYAEHQAGSCGSPQVKITGSSTITLNGGMYFPNASVCMTGGSFSTSESCLSLVAWSVYYNGNATEKLSGCSATGTQTAQTRAVNLVQ